MKDRERELDAELFVRSHRRVALTPAGRVSSPSPSLPAPAWTGVRGATAFGSQCPQAIGGVEDCLYLNVYTPPHATAGRSLPVMVYIPGGAFVVGAGSDYDPTPSAAGVDLDACAEV